MMRSAQGTHRLPARPVRHLILCAGLLALLSSPVAAQSFEAFIVRLNITPEPTKSALIDSFMNAHATLPWIETDTLVHFVYRGAAGSVTLAGDMTAWSPTAAPLSRVPGTDFWYRSETFESDARLDYKFVLNGNSWILDPRNPLQILSGFGPNSELRMPKYEPPPEIEDRPDIPHGTVVDTTAASAILGNSRKVRIYLPPGYAETSDAFPMVLFHDGLEYLSLARADRVLNYLIHLRRIQPLIAVFVPPVERTQEYAGSRRQAFARFLVEELLPALESRFRLRSEARYRAVVGASNGGNISLYLGLFYSEVFGNVAAQSSNVEPDIAEGYRSGPRLNLKLYLDLGTYDIPLLIERVRRFVPVLDSKGYPFIYQEFHEGHSWGNWRAHLDDALQYFFPATTTGVESAPPAPMDFVLVPNYPNPFAGETRLALRLQRSALVTVTIYDLLGRHVRTLTAGKPDGGTVELVWNGLDSDGRRLPNGVYVYRVRLDGRLAHTGRMLLLR